MDVRTNKMDHFSDQIYLLIYWFVHIYFLYAVPILFILTIVFIIDCHNFFFLMLCKLEFFYFHDKDYYFYNYYLR